MGENVAVSGTLVILGGLPGTGKSTVGRELARRLGAVVVRIDSIERPMREAGWDVGGVGYAAAQAVAEENLRIGNTVIADCVNPWPLTRAAWRAVADRAGARALEVEFVCSNPFEHRRRIEDRRASDPDAAWPSWQDVVDRDYRPWDTGRVVVDTAVLPAEDAVITLVALVGASNARGAP